ncbi:conserved hypothetical protein [Gammaproteobacteria bacterium]
MSYSQFTLSNIEEIFHIQLIEKITLFSNIIPLQIPNRLSDLLEYNLPLALANNTEKARSEMIISPILIELKRQLNNKISLFSGLEFNVDEEKGLMGYCDFIISNSIEQLFIKSPIIMLVEAKNENIKNGIAQCIAEMIAAQLFNKKQKNLTATIYGIVTTGTNWKFLKLISNQVEISLTEYYISELDQILGILISIVVGNKSELEFPCAVSAC